MVVSNFILKMDGHKAEFHKEYSLEELEELKFAAEVTPFEVLLFFSLVDKVKFIGIFNFLHV